MGPGRDPSLAQSGRAFPFPGKTRSLDKCRDPHPPLKFARISFSFRVLADGRCAAIPVRVLLE